MAKTFAVETKFTANDRLSGALKRIGAEFNHVFGGLGQRLGRDLDAARKVSTTLFRMGQIGFEAGKAIFSSVTDATTALDKIAKTSQRTGVSLKMFQELEYATGQAGASTEEFSAGLETFGKNLGQMKGGMGRFNTFLGKVSPAMRKAVLAAPDVDAALMTVFEGLSRLEDPSKRAAFAMAAFGDSGATLALATKDGVAGLEAMRAEANKYGLVLPDEAFPLAEKFSDEIDKLGRVWQGGMRMIGMSVAEAALPKLLELTAWIADNKTEVQQFFADVGRGIVDGVKALVDAGKWIVENKDSLIDWAKVLGTVYLGSIVIPALTTTLGLLGSIGKIAMSTAGWLARIAGFGGAAAAGAGTAAAAGAGTAVGGGLLSRISGFAARFARMAGPLGALISTFDASPTANTGLEGRKKGAFEDATRGLTGMMNSGRNSAAAGAAADRDARRNAAARIARETMLGPLDRAFGAAPAAGGQSKVQVEFVNAPAGMVVREIKAAPGQSVDVKTKRGARALGTGSGL